jgi:hypothetical protein
MTRAEKIYNRYLELQEVTGYWDNHGTNEQYYKHVGLMIRFEIVLKRLKYEGF